MRGHIGQGKLIFLCGLVHAVLRQCNAAQNCVQTVIVAVDLLDFVEKWTGCIGLSDVEPGLRRTQFKTNIPFRRLCQARIKRRGLLRFAGELIGVGQFGLHIDCLGRDGLQRRDRFVVLPLIAILSGHRPQNFRIARGAALGAIQISCGLIRLSHTFVSVGDQHVAVRRRLQSLRPLQQGQSGFRIGAQHELTGELQAVRVLWVGFDHSAQQLLCFLSPAHLGIGLGEPRQSADRVRLQLQSMIVRIDRERITLGQSRGITQQEPHFSILRRRFRSLFRVGDAPLHSRFA